MKALGTRMRKLVLGLSVAQILPEKINKTLSPKKLGFIDVNRTVKQTFIFSQNNNGLRSKTQNTIHIRMYPKDQLFCDKRKFKRLNKETTWIKRKLNKYFHKKAVLLKVYFSNHKIFCVICRRAIKYQRTFKQNQYIKYDLGIFSFCLESNSHIFLPF